MVKIRLAILVVLLAAILSHQCADGESKVPCLFIFGDSLSDSGNNNMLVTDARANYTPYGIDFYNGTSTGRFTNGRTSVDLIAQLLGFDDLIPPFVNTQGSNMLKGVNYASGAAGIHDETGKHLGECNTLNQQLRNHEVTIANISRKQGNGNSTKDYLSKCLHYVNIGTNDYINNYFIPKYYPTSRLYNPEQYATVLIQEYNQQLRTLYQLGARKFALTGVVLIGCLPAALSTRPNNDSSSCVTEMNDAAIIFNAKLKSLVDQLNQDLPSAKFISIDPIAITLVNSSAGGINQNLDLLFVVNIEVSGFNVSNVGCCSIGSNGLCIPNQAPCQNRNEYAFWDAFHPTEAANQITANRSYEAQSLFDAYPTDISHII